MEPWLIINAQTGAPLRTQAEATPLAEGEQAVERSAGNMVEPPLSVWSPAARGWMDVPLVDGPMMGRLLTMVEVAAMAGHPAAEIRVAFNVWLFMAVTGRCQRINSPLHVDTADLMLAAGVFATPERHAQFLAGEPVGETE